LEASSYHHHLTSPSPKQPVDFDIRDKHSDCEAKEKKNFIIRNSLFDIRYSDFVL